MKAGKFTTEELRQNQISVEKTEQATADAGMKMEVVAKPRLRSTVFLLDR
jgi:sensor c-di-GMP phosphodiesterase-like protein